ncbi:type II 3-dehydroquinate dehydratase [Lancefieldella sp. Marseille-Q7238]|uniref:type II 3-dehydroquinate dehydratase n=1 Tax=Lancefieldella sp. Marseille-Q7238 TaxID=3022127 RepID=UPI0024A92B09|nr:type II 3-dehydroquinate dehydratase [Lancefieldella sp. Marseille-Q7238]
MNTQQVAENVLFAVGGSDNLVDNEVCMTRLRLTVNNPALIDHEKLAGLQGVLGIVGRGANGIEVVFGPNVASQVNASLDVCCNHANLSAKITPDASLSPLSDDENDVEQLISLLRDADLSADDLSHTGTFNVDSEVAEEPEQEEIGPRLLVINGPNINMLGIREPELYGKQDYRALIRICKEEATAQGFVDCVCYQSNYEGDLISAIQDALGAYDAILINPAAYTHTSIALLDAAKAVQIPMVEVHLTDITEREEYRRVSYLRDACIALCCGKGFDSYREGIAILAERVKETC